MSPIKKLDPKQVKELSSLFAIAENITKKAGYLNKGLMIPAVNQLRYACFHLIKLIIEGEDDDHLVKALNHCKRAIYDSSEAAVIWYVEKFLAFEEDYRNTAIHQVVPNINNYRKIVGDFVKLVDETNGIVVDCWEDSDSEDHRVNNWEAMSTRLDDLVEICEELDNARVDLNKIMKRDRWLFVAALATIAALLLALGIKILDCATDYNKNRKCQVKNETINKSTDNTDNVAAGKKKSSDNLAK